MESVKKQLSKEHGISVHFSSQHENYYGAWSYVTKEDTDFIQYKKQPVLTGTPRTSLASRANKRKKTENSFRINNKCRRLDSLSVANTIVQNNIKRLCSEYFP